MLSIWGLFTLGIFKKYLNAKILYFETPTPSCYPFILFNNNIWTLYAINHQPQAFTYFLNEPWFTFHTVYIFIYNLSMIHNIRFIHSRWISWHREWINCIFTRKRAWNICYITYLSYKCHINAWGAEKCYQKLRPMKVGLQFNVILGSLVLFSHEIKTSLVLIYR